MRSLKLFSNVEYSLSQWYLNLLTDTLKFVDFRGPNQGKKGEKKVKKVLLVIRLHLYLDDTYT